MKNTLILLSSLFLLGACVYAESPDGRFAAIDLPVHNQTTVHKTITVNAPPGTTVNISETPPPTVIYRDRPHRHRDWQRCYYEQRPVARGSNITRPHRVCY